MVFTSAIPVLRKRPPPHGRSGICEVAAGTGYHEWDEPLKMATGMTPTVGERNVIFYDGDCALCHGFVRFLLARDGDGRQFLFSPLQGHLITQLVNPAIREALPDTLVLRTTDGQVHIHSEAVLGALGRLGGIWRAAAIVGRIAPRGVRDAVYAWVARTRRRLFGGTPYQCPLVPSHLRDRFVD
jgi:predicted DCC family thiol-disulfide oxidoreductase YuxK